MNQNREHRADTTARGIHCLRGSSYLSGSFMSLVAPIQKSQSVEPQGWTGAKNTKGGTKAGFGKG